VVNPVFVPYTAAALMIAISLYCVGRLVLVSTSSRHSHVDVSVSHALMGVGMAGMFVPSHNLFSEESGLLIFGTIAAWFFVSAVRFVVTHGLRGSYADNAHGISHPLIHMVMAGAMIYMYAIAPISSGNRLPAMAMGGGRTEGPALLTLAFVVVLLTSAVLQLNAVGQVASSPSPRALAVVASGGGARGGFQSAPQSVSEAAFRPRLEVACHVIMCLAMVYMLFLLV